MTNPTASNAISAVTLASFAEERASIVRVTVARSLERTEVAQHGEDAERLLTLGLDFTTQALIVAMQLGNYAVLDQQLEWANQRLPHDGVSSKQLLGRFQILSEVVNEILAPLDAEAVNRYVGYLIQREAEFVESHSL